MPLAGAWLERPRSMHWEAQRKIVGCISAPLRTILQCNIGAGTACPSMSHSPTLDDAHAVPPSANGETHAKTAFWALALGSLGVVYGDIGTSPLYALRES